MNREQILAILYELAIVIGGEVRLRPLLTKVLQRLIFHTTFPCGMIFLDTSAVRRCDFRGESALLPLELAIGDAELAAREGTEVPVPVRLLRGEAEVGEDPELLEGLPCRGKGYRVFLRLPIGDCGVILLLARRVPATAFLAGVFRPVLSNLEKSIHLCRSTEAYTRSLIVDRDQAEEALRVQFHQFSAIFDSMDALVFVSDILTGEILFMNAYGALHFEKGLKGARCAEIFAGRLPFFASGPGAVAEPGELRAVVELQDGVSGTWFGCIEQFIPWPDGRQVRLGIAFDITRQKEVEKFKTEVIAAVSHELGTPLTAMIGYAEYLLNHRVGTDRRREFLRTILSESERLNDLVVNFHDLQAEWSAAPARLFPLEVPPLLEEAADLAAERWTGHRFTVAAPMDLPPVYGDRMKLLTMVGNLLSNAAKFSPDGGGVDVAARLSEGFVVIEVTDRGVGIAPEELERIFERFYRIDNSDRRLTSGAGLGLAVVREIAEKHGGRVWAESGAGRGSTFRVALPVALVTSLPVRETDV